MNQDEIIRMAREAGMYQDLNVSWNQSIQNFAKLVAATEREKVAKQWEQWHGFDKHTVAAFIRARGEAK
jgi:hypothetical protein